MTSEDFIKVCYDNLIIQATKQYESWLRDTPLDEITDNYFLDATSFFRGLDEAQKDLLLNIIKQVKVDSLASFFAVIDGTYGMKGLSSNVALVFENKKGYVEDLSDLFLEAHEEQSDS